MVLRWYKAVIGVAMEAGLVVPAMFFSMLGLLLEAEGTLGA